MHESVALDRSIELLAPAILKSENPILVDATLGLGGHSFALLERFPNLKIIGIDRDKSAIAEAKSRLANFGDRIQIAHSVFDKITEVVNGFGYQKIDGALFDLGVSSMQLDQPIRGFSYSQEAPLDMRMDQSRGITADEIVNTWDKNEIVRILRNFGEEKFAPRIVDSIIAARPIKSTSQLAEIVKKAIPAATRRTGGNPAKRTFQALRIAVNDELGAISRAIPQALELLNVGGRLVVLSFQSLEDRLVKEAFGSVTTSTLPRDLPISVPGHELKYSLVIRGSEGASDVEISENSRAQSVRIRAIEKVAA
jgi:16S rRNA (cytosine1402-N4)-methyltransferase